jgi:hypothetical protein
MSRLSCQFWQRGYGKSAKAWSEVNNDATNRTCQETLDRSDHTVQSPKYVGRPRHRGTHSINSGRGC